MLSGSKKPMRCPAGTNSDASHSSAFRTRTFVGSFFLVDVDPSVDMTTLEHDTEEFFDSIHLFYNSRF